MDTAMRIRPAWYRRAGSAVSLVILIALIEYVVLPRLSVARESLHRVTELNPVWVMVAVALEASSLVSYSLFSRALLGRHGIRFSWILRTDLTGYGVSHVVPGGAATATALRFRLLVIGGVRATNVTATITAEAIGSWLALALVAWLSLIPGIQLVAVFGASQVAGVLPGVQGASPRDGALVAGLASLGVSWTAAFGAVALTALLYWVPALLIGGSCLFLRWRGWFTEPPAGTT